MNLVPRPLISWLRPLLERLAAFGIRSIAQENAALFASDVMKANQKAAAEIAAKVTKQPAERFGWLFTEKDYYRDPNMLPNLDALQRNLDMTADLGFVKGKVDLATHVDLSIVKEAAARIK